MAGAVKRVLGGMACVSLVGTVPQVWAVVPGFAGGSAAGLLDGRQDGVWTFHHENVLCTSLEVTVRARSHAEAERAESALLGSIDRENLILSEWDKQSELSRWLAMGQGEAVKVSPELLEVLGLFDAWREKTKGALDASAETAVRVWRHAAAEGRKPTELEVAQAVEAMQQRHWELDREAGTAKRVSGAPVALASFAKSYIASRAVDVALRAGAAGVTVNLGGDVVVRGDVTQRVEIADPRAHGENDAAMEQVVVRGGNGGMAVATSGSYRRGFGLAAGALSPEYSQTFSHILDPRTALPSGHVLSSTVMSKDAVTAGALATAFSVMTVAESQELAGKTPGVEYLLVTREGERIASEGWAQYQAPVLHTVGYAVPQKKVAVAAAKDPWSQGYELAVNLELAQIDSPRYHRPYLAVWVEDENHVAVRTIAVWFNKMRYLPELKAWYRDDQTRTGAGGADILGTVSSATRSPGKYTLKWDGKDNAGKVVKPGKYTICVESAREHGGSAFLHEEMEFGAKPLQHTFEAGSELGAVTLDYRKQ